MLALLLLFYLGTVSGWQMLAGSGKLGGLSEVMQ